MTYRVYITADFDHQADAEKALSDMEEVIEKQDGELLATDIEYLDARSDRSDAGFTREPAAPSGWV